MKIVTVIGTRPQFIKAAPGSRALARRGVEQVLVDTGQHYDDLIGDGAAVARVAGILGATGDGTA